MSVIIKTLTDFNAISILVRLLLAVIVGGLIGSERGKHGSAAGLRTHILVCIGSAMTALTGLYASNTLHASDDILRLAAQVISGIGFLGAGMIIVKNGNVVTGLTTAAGMWATAAIGIALGFGFYVGALVATVACFFTTAVLTRMERKRKETTHIYIEIDLTKKINDILDKVRTELDMDALIETVAPKSNVGNTVGVYVTVSNLRTVEEIKNHIDGIDGIVFWVLE
ncbi:MAG: MgtC/SapB family protein [Clostridia bacterium]|nr:MgtC/SapB family protein [Clostridia bacterium]